jgi:1-acyl-sn-glycerol-3-phosphate acyltransferase
MLVFILNTVFWCVPFYVLVGAKVAVPHRGWRSACTRALLSIAESWSAMNDRGLWATQKTRWEVSGLEGLSRKAWYLVSCNHRSWVDIVVLQKVFNRRIPFPRYFLKKNLIWVPLLGGAWWALEYPFMKRHSKDFLERNPERRGEDFETTLKACERYRTAPATILNFPEGTRFTPEKHRAQGSPYRNLLRPKAGAMASAIEGLGDRVRSVLDVTIVYSRDQVRLWDLLSGRVKKIIVDVRSVEIPEEFRHGGYVRDARFRERFQIWLGELWSSKDSLIEAIRSGFHPERARN